MQDTALNYHFKNRLPKTSTIYSCAKTVVPAKVFKPNVFQIMWIISPLLGFTGNSSLQELGDFSAENIVSITNSKSLERQLRREYFSFIKPIGFEREDMSFDSLY